MKSFERWTKRRRRYLPTKESLLSHIELLLVASTTAGCVMYILEHIAETLPVKVGIPMRKSSGTRKVYSYEFTAEQWIFPSFDLFYNIKISINLPLHLQLYLKKRLIYIFLQKKALWTSRVSLQSKGRLGPSSLFREAEWCGGVRSLSSDGALYIESSFSVGRPRRSCFTSSSTLEAPLFLALSLSIASVVAVGVWGSRRACSSSPVSLARRTTTRVHTASKLLNYRCSRPPRPPYSEVASYRRGRAVNGLCFRVPHISTRPKRLSLWAPTSMGRGWGRPSYNPLPRPVKSLWGLGWLYVVVRRL